LRGSWGRHYHTWSIEYIADLYLQGNYSEGVPMLMMGGLATGAGLLSLTLPETLNQPMPETLSDLD
jgi:hypothetical protein